MLTVYMHRYSKHTLIVILTVLSSKVWAERSIPTADANDDNAMLVSIQQEATKEPHLSSHPLGNDDGYIPEGFEDIDPYSEHDVEVTLFTQDASRSNVQVNLDRDHITFLKPLSVMPRSSETFDARAVSAVLAKQPKQPIQSFKACKTNQRRQVICCNHTAKKIEFYVQRDEYQVHMCIPKVYWKRQPGQMTLGKSNEMTYKKTPTYPLALSGITTVNSSLNKASSVYTQSIEGSLSYHNVTGTVDGNVTVTRENEPGSSGKRRTKWDYQIGTASIQMFNNRWRYNLGLTDTNTDLEANTLYGITAQTQDDMILSRPARDETLSVVAEYSGIVRIYKNQQLLRSARVSSGINSISTTTFPQGVYDVRIELLYDNGQKEQKTSIFRKQLLSLPMANYPDYVIAVGVPTHSSGESNSVTILPSLKSQPEVIGSVRWLTSSVTAAELAGQASTKRIGGKIGYVFIGENINSNIDVIARSDMSFSATVGIGAKTSALSTSGSFIISKGPVGSEDADLTKEGIIGLGYSYAGWASNLSTIYSSSGQHAGDLSVQFSTSHTVDLFRNIVSFGGALNLGKKNKSISLTVSLKPMTYNKWHFNASLKSNISLQKNDDQEGYSLSTLISRKIIDSVARKADFFQSLDVSNEGIAGTTNVKFSGETIKANSEINLTKFINTSENSLTWTINNSLQTGFALSSDGFNVGNMNGSSGVIVSVDGVDESAKSSVKLGQNEVAVIKGSGSVLVPLSPFQKRVLFVESDSQDSLYDFENGGSTNVMVLPGSVGVVRFHAKKIRQLMGYVVNSNGEPLSNAFVEKSKIYDGTDSSGFISMSVLGNQRKITFIYNNGRRCSISVPQDSQKVVFKERLLCK